MCARYTLIATLRELQSAFELFDLPAELDPYYNIAPSSWVPIIIREPNAQRHYRFMRWGLVPGWAHDDKSGPINARAETVAEKPMFKASLRRKRCLVPATGFFEWKEVDGRKQPYYFTVNGGAPFAFAGLWEQRDGIDGVLETFTILTTSPNELVSEYHDRMPVILPPSAYADWLDPFMQKPEPLLPLLGPYPAGKMSAHPVTKRMSNPRFNDPSVVEPISVV
jgi:putative SOS response-associated peptidase YedK